jgi:3-ketoacyl-CoA synthase
VLAHIETYGGVAGGQTLWQLAFGAGLKCNSLVWRAVQPIREEHPAWLAKGGGKAAVKKL